MGRALLGLLCLPLFLIYYFLVALGIVYRESREAWRFRGGIYRDRKKPKT